MYISRWIARGVALAVAAILVPTIVRPIINPNNLNTSDKGFSLMPGVIMVFATIILAVLAWGQLQYAYHLFSLNRLLHTVADGRVAFKFAVDRNAVASVTYANGRYRIEVVEQSSEDVMIYLVTESKIEVRRLTTALRVVPANDAFGFSQVTFDEEIVSPDYRVDMRRLKRGLQLA